MVKNNFYRLIYYWLPPIIWMVVIFIFSSRQRIEVSPELVINFLVFKSLHIIEYLILYLLFFRAFLSGKKIAKKKILLLSFVFALIYAASDEVHQRFIPTREGKALDVIIDCIGLTIGYYIGNKYFEILNRFLV